MLLQTASAAVLYSGHMCLLTHLDTTPLLKGSNQDRMFNTVGVEIEQLLAKLTGINDKMAECTSVSGMTSHSAALMHTLQRHRDILQDYTHEFHKTKGNFLAVREREDLLGSLKKEMETYKSSSGVNNRRTELFLKEHEHLRNSDRLLDDTISIAMATKENMTSQRGLLKSIQSRVNTLANRFPAINNLIQRINLRKRRDSFILGGVIGVCTILLLLYAFH
ncbi:Golgi SNAP receptor complex member 1-like isoform X2 [Paramormyrops kingsleyae]|uniref:Golgi SNAP receptor complex member 1-like isoform X2 n=1 Tax=Paramormyrops kingsleyae TaxID=1676925 RepID=UPI000CD61DDD|nr:Golgi SNAP receptor complex member 1-like isoform X2 [Paramormyrops kingsleyae]